MFSKKLEDFMALMKMFVVEISNVLSLNKPNIPIDIIFSLIDSKRVG
jgi:hypothetical protein